MNIESMDTSVFQTMSQETLNKIQHELQMLRRKRRNQYIKPRIKQHMAPFKENVLKPIKAQHIDPINKVLRELNRCKKKEDKYFRLPGDDRIYGPYRNKKQFTATILEISNQTELK